jgi:acetylornithine deacetylase/succinyl-diaminopimelate desuccinylase-like protein
MSVSSVSGFIDAVWDEDVVPCLTDYIRIPNKSPAFDPNWAANGHMDRAVELFAEWAKRKIVQLPGAELEVLRLPGRTPLILIDIPGDAPGNILLYGHLDKQPEMAGWAEGTGPWEPVLRDDRLYGRGGADDGYAMFSAIVAILATQREKHARSRCLILIEASEESGSPDLPSYLAQLTQRLGIPELVICLDSGAGNYEQLWLTSSLRGIVVGALTVRVLLEGVHSGSSSGIVPSSFRILRTLLSRIEDESSGRILLPELHANPPPEAAGQARETAQLLGDGVWDSLPWFEQTSPMATSGAELLAAKTWRPQLAVTGIDGYPNVQSAGNVLLPFTTAKLSIRVPPGVDANLAASAIKKTLERDPPYNAGVIFELLGAEAGWAAPALTDRLKQSLNSSSEAVFGKPCAIQGEGGSIPFMAMLGRQFPAAQFVITGVLGPHSNAHGPNEFLDIGYAKKITECVYRIIADHSQSP